MSRHGERERLIKDQLTQEESEAPNRGFSFGRFGTRLEVSNSMEFVRLGTGWRIGLTTRHSFVWVGGGLKDVVVAYCP